MTKEEYPFIVCRWVLHGTFSSQEKMMASI
jgi:hypothetical protein